MKTFSVWILTGALALIHSPAMARKWTQAANPDKPIEAEFVRVEGNYVILRYERDGKMTNGRVPIGTLIVDDQNYIKEQLEKGANADAPWPQWRGPNQDGISPDTGLMKEWPDGGPEKLWTFDDAGLGYSGFTIAEGKLFTMGTRGGDFYVIAIDAEKGFEVWSEKVGRDDQQGYNTGWGHGPRGNPTYSDGLIYALDPKGGLYCLRAADGKSVWERQLQEEFSGQAGGWGYSESPLVDGDKLIVAPGGDEASIVALDKKTGTDIWSSDIRGAGKAEYATILVTEMEGVRQYIKFFQTLLVGVRADNGEEIWRSEWPPGRVAVIPTPIVDGNQVYITSGYGAGSKLVEVNGSSARDVWVNNDMKNHHGGVVKIGDHVYGFSDGPGLSCQSWETGELLWNQRGQFTSKGAIHAADGMLYCLNERDGTLLLVTATPDGFEQKGQFKLEPQSSNRHPQGKIWTHPLVVNGKLYLRDQEFISCYDVKE